ncbi:MAG: ROK family transcriptional regulator [Christensenella hongkongensis]|uniref:ROK family transcriptional regulator n=1 Tax=Christensenella hongkongensis TaxID=270498 RepID=UPI0026727291|nr:ROK family transcriptional regulator [Christensenella hongkongensis]MDY3004961.1 ROK family transcriptional regulator [Christensenella hongkongensis]
MASKNINSAKMKENNIQLVFDAIRENEKISRKDLARKLGLTSATITNIVNHLLRENYLVESGLEESSGGRKPILLSLNKAAHYLIGIELSSVRINCVLTDFRANIIGEIHLDIDAAAGKDVIIEQIIHVLESIIAENGLHREQVIGIGLITPGPCDFEKNLIINPPNLPGWHNVPIKQIVEERIGIPVEFEKETAAAAMCEYWFGQAKDSKCLFLCSVMQSGIGSSVLIDGKIFHGFCSGSGEIGHMMVDMNGPQCACGNYGCLEALADGKALVRSVRQKLKTDAAFCREYGVEEIDALELEDVCARAEDGERLFAEEVAACAKYVGIALCNIIVALSPDTIILTGALADHSPFFMRELKRFIKGRTYPQHTEKINIYHSSFGRNIDALGGVALVFERIFKS